MQFLSSLLAPGGPGKPGGLSTGAANLLIGYGVNDCEAKIGRVALKRVWRMLQPVPGEGDVCERLGPAEMGGERIRKRRTALLTKAG